VSAVNVQKTWSELEPHEWGGSLATIQRAETEVLRIYKESTEKAGAYWLSATTDLFRFACPAPHLAGVFTERVLEYTEGARTRRFGLAEFDETSAANRLFACIYPGVEANDELIYTLGGQQLTAILYCLMTSNIRRIFGRVGRMLVFGDFGQVWVEFLRHFGASEFDALLYRTLHSLVNVMSYSFVRRLALHWRPQYAVDWLLGIRDDPAHFLVSEVELAAYRSDEVWLETLTASPDYLNLPSYYSPESDSKVKYRPLRIKGSTKDWRMRYAVAEAVTQAPWQENDRPFAYVAESARNVMRHRVSTDEAEHIAAHSKKIALEALTVEIVDSATQALVPVETEPLPIVDDIRSVFERLPLHPDVRQICLLRIEGTEWKEIPKQLSWTKRRAEAARAKFMRAQPKIREALAKQITWLGTPTGVFAGGTVYRERSYSGAASWTHRPINPTEH
jgi:hypothetical protein